MSLFTQRITEMIFESGETVQALAEAGIETRPVFHPMHHLPPYFEKAAYPVADKWAQRGINLPTHCALTGDDCRYIAEKLIDAVKRGF